MRPVNREVVVHMVHELLGADGSAELADAIVGVLGERGCGWRLVPTVLADMNESSLAILVDEAQDRVRNNAR